MTYCGPFVPHFPRRTSTLRRRLASPLAIHRSQLTSLSLVAVARVLKERWTASCLSVSIGILPWFVGRALRHPWLRELPPLDARSPLGHSGAVSVPRASSLRLPYVRSLRPATRDVANVNHWQAFPLGQACLFHRRFISLHRFVSRSAGRHRATGLSHAATIQVAVPSASALYPGWRLPAEDCDALRVRRRRVAPVALYPAWRASGPVLRWLPAIAVFTLLT